MTDTSMARLIAQAIHDTARHYASNGNHDDDLIASAFYTLAGIIDDKVKIITDHDVSNLDKPLPHRTTASSA